MDDDFEIDSGVYGRRIAEDGSAGFENSFARFQIDTQKDLEQLDHFLMGHIWVNGEWKSTGKPILNEKGRLAFMMYTQNHINRVTHLSKFGFNDIMQIMRDVCDDLILNISGFADEYELAEENFDFLLSSLEHFILSMFLSALDGGMRQHLGQVSKIVERHGYAIDQKKKDGLASLGGG